MAIVVSQSRRSCRKRFFILKKVRNALPATKYEVYICAAVVLCVALWCRMRWRCRRFYRLADKIKGPPSYPLKGSMYDLRTTPESEDEGTRAIGPTVVIGVLRFHRNDVQLQRLGRQIRLRAGQTVGRPVPVRRSVQARGRAGKSTNPRTVVQVKSSTVVHETRTRNNRARVGRPANVFVS